MRKKLLGVVLPLLAFLLFSPTSAWSAKIVQNDYKIDSIDPGIKLFVRECWQIFTPICPTSADAEQSIYYKI